MNGSALYVLDSNVFMEAAKRYYAFDIVPAFWENLERLSNAHQIVSIDRVKIEIDRGNDELKSWADNNLAGAFESTDRADVVAQYRTVMAWVQGQTQYSMAAKADFAGIADGWLVAFALNNDSVVVTQEVINLDIKRKIPIPNICQALGVQFIDTFGMLRALRVTL